MDEPDPKKVLGKALVRASEELGLSNQDLSEIFSQICHVELGDEVDPKSEVGEIATMIINIYRNLYNLVGGNAADMKHWMYSYNTDLNGVPAELINSKEGLVNVLGYLEAMCR